MLTLALAEVNLRAVNSLLPRVHIQL